MKRAFAIVCVLVALLAGVSVAACAASNDDAQAGDAEAGPTSSEDAARDDGPTPETDATATRDAGADAPADAAEDSGPAPKYGLPVDPGFIACGGSACNLDGGLCCTYFGGEDNNTYYDQCNPTGIPCSNPYAPPQGTRQCDETADCVAGQVCCMTSAYGVSACMTSCPSTAVRLCKSHAECGAAGPCVVQLCGGTNHITRQVQSCGKVPHALNWVCAAPPP